MKVIYIDVLFAVNFIIDFLLVNLTARLRGNIIGGLRAALAAALGGAMAAAAFFLPESLGLTLLSKPICCLAVVYCAFGFSDIKRLLGDCLMLCVLSFVFAGGAYALAQLFPESGEVSHGTVYFDISLRTLAAGAAVSYMIFMLICRPGSLREEKSSRKICCRIGNTDLSFNAFEDTGNMLSDPLLKKKIIMVSPSVLLPALSYEERQVMKELGHEGAPDVFERLSLISPGRYGMAPYTAVSGRGLIVTVRPDSLFIDGKESSEYVLGISGEEIATVCGCRALIGC